MWKAEQGEDDDELEDAVPGDLPTGGPRNVRNYSLESVDLDKITLLPPDSNRKADGNLVRYEPKMPELVKFRYEFVVTDESHNAKKPDGAYNYMLRVTQYNTLLWVSGTQLAGSARNLISPLILMWRAYKITWNPSTVLLG